MLTDKQKRFIEEYLIDLNAKQAAVRAGYSPKSAEVEGSRLLRNAKVAAAIASAQAARSERTEITQDMVLRELAKIGFQDIRKAVKWGINPGDSSSENATPNGLNIYPVSLVPSEKIDDDTAAAIAEISLTQTGIKVKMHDKRAALVDIGRHLGMFKEKIEHSGPDGGPVQIQKVERIIVRPSDPNSGSVPPAA